LLAGKRGATALGCALLKYYSRLGSFPRSRAELPETVIGFVARQVGVEAAVLGSYEWWGRTVEYHRAEIREHLGFRVATVADQQRLTSWLASRVAHAERREDRVREELLAQFRAERIEAPTPGRVLRMVRSALRTTEQTWTARISARLDGLIRARVLALIAATSDEDVGGGDQEEDAESVGAMVLGLIKSEPGQRQLGVDDGRDRQAGSRPGDRSPAGFVRRCGSAGGGWVAGEGGRGSTLASAAASAAVDGDVAGRGGASA